MWDKVKPQAMAAILGVVVITLTGLLVGWRMDAVEIVTAALGGALGFMGGVTVQIYDKDKADGS